MAWALFRIRAGVHRNRGILSAFLSHTADIPCRKGLGAGPRGRKCAVALTDHSV